MEIDGQQLRDYWGVLLRRRWVVYLAVSTLTLVALIGSFLVTPLYRATVTLQIERQNPDVLNIRDLAQVDHSWASATPNANRLASRHSVMGNRLASNLPSMNGYGYCRQLVGSEALLRSIVFLLIRRRQVARSTVSAGELSAL